MFETATDGIRLVRIFCDRPRSLATPPIPGTMVETAVSEETAAEIRGVFFSRWTCRAIGS